MYRFSYAEIAEDAPTECREREYEIFGRAIELMREAEGHPAQSPEMLNALVFLQRLWAVLIRDLSHADNALPDRLKAQLISIGFWVMRESDCIVRGEHNDLTSLIDINLMIQEGLK